MSLTNPIPRGTREATITSAPGQIQFGPLDFLLYDAADLEVWVKQPGAEFATRLDPSAFTVTPALPASVWPAFPQVTLAAPPATGSMVTIRGVRVPERAADVTRDGVLQSQSLELDLDKIVVVEQELRRDIDRGAGRIDDIESVAAHVDEARDAAEAAKTAAEAARDIAVEAAGSNITAVAVRANVALIEVPGDFVRTAGLLAAGDSGGALYKRVPNEPGHPGKVQDSTGAWFEVVPSSVTHQFGSIAEAQAAALDAPVGLTILGDIVGGESTFRSAGTVDPELPGQIEVPVSGVTHFYTRSNKILRPQQFGCKTGGDPTANRAALVEMFALADADGREIDMGSRFDVYEIDDTISKTWVRSPQIFGSGATIKLNRGANPAVTYGLYFDLLNVGGNLEGFGVDGNFQTPNPFWIENTASSYVEADVHDLRLTKISTYRGYRQTLGDFGGRGLSVRGAFRSLIARECSAEDMKMAVGAGNPGNQGIIGLFFGRNTNQLQPIYKTIIDPYVDKVYSEDPTNLIDMDGMSIFDVDRSAPAPIGTTVLRGGLFRNCHGRGIKFQGYNGDFEAPQFYLTTAPNGARTICCIDFQYGSGSIRGGHLRYNGAVPNNIVFGTAIGPNNYDSRGIDVDNFSVTGQGNEYQPISLVYRYSEPSHENMNLTVRNCRVAAEVQYLVRFHTRVTTEMVRVLDNTVSAIQSGGAGIELTGASGSAVRTVFKGNIIAGGTNRAMASVTTVTNTMIGTTADNGYFT